MICGITQSYGHSQVNICLLSTLFTIERIIQNYFESTIHYIHNTIRQDFGNINNVLINNILFIDVSILCEK